MRRLLAPPLLLTACALAGCTHDEVARVPPRQAVVIVQRDYRLDPQAVEVGHGRTTFRVRNASKGPHNFVLRRGERRTGRIATLAPGESGKLTVRLRRGTYTMYCGIGHHEELGEYGTVTVR